MLVCRKCGSLMVSNGRFWYCPSQGKQTQYDKHPGVEFREKRATVHREVRRQVA